MIKKIFIALVLAIGLLCGYAATKPDVFEVKRSLLINAPAAKVYPLISELKAFNTWNPFLEQEPTAKLTYSGPASGVGSAYSWKGDKTGSGRMEVAALVEGQSATYKLDFYEPMQGRNTVDFVLTPKGNATEMSWTMKGPATFVSKLMDVVMGIDKMVGQSFEKGLANLKALAEKA